ncbi:hypothetical protein ALC53_06563 [Atta colombica]|uniref:Reverse transcriptase domain-containing protein n=1 Tax=Atta colombica TaxID=520822 RepID=A0A151I3F3_9HYME|nr:hypothetical protein ALC53_06563 [Atta colombica]
MLIYREKESDFSSGSKRYTTVWAKLTEKMKENSNGKYAVTRKKSGNCRNTLLFNKNLVMDSIFGKKVFVMLPVIASSENLFKSINTAESAVAESPSLPSTESEAILETTFIDVIKQNRETANNFMEHFEKEALRKILKKPEVWFRYVDDTFVIWRHGRADLRKFLIFLNNQQPNMVSTSSSKDDQFFRRGIRTLRPKDGKVVASDGQYFES